jgi:hypothetical protein
MLPADVFLQNFSTKLVGLVQKRHCRYSLFLSKSTYCRLLNCVRIMYVFKLQSKKQTPSKQKAADQQQTYTAPPQNQQIPKETIIPSTPIISAIDGIESVHKLSQPEAKTSDQQVYPELTYEELPTFIKERTWIKSAPIPETEPLRFFQNKKEIKIPEKTAKKYNITLTTTTNTPNHGQAGALTLKDPKTEPRLQRAYPPPYTTHSREKDMSEAYIKFSEDL